LSEFLKRWRPGRDYHRMQAMRFLVGLAAVVVAGACAPEPAVGIAYYIPPDHIEEDPCPPDGCGGNSPVMNGVFFWRVYFGDQPDAAGPEDVRVTGVHRNGVPMKLRVADGDYLVGVDPVMPWVVLAHGTTLPGTRIKVSLKGEPYEILVSGAAPTEKFWVGAKLPIWRYELRYRALSGGDTHYFPLCSEADGDPDMIQALVFEGDDYTPDTKQITVGPQTAGWMNIACADSAIYKMHTTGHTTAAQKNGLLTTPAQRHAMLNAWTSNVCGTGEAFTKQGEPIRLRPFTGTVNKAPYNGPMASAEAIWDESGAVCLNTHRLHEDDPTIYSQIAEACGGELPPNCDAMLGSWKSHGHVLTGNP
jgi:hypothetical protein